MEYPYSNPLFINDSVFVAYGGETGTSTQAQRNASYLIAEKQMTAHLGTFLLPTQVTGTYYYPANHTPLVLDYGYVRSIDDITIHTVDFNNSCKVTDYDGSSVIRNAKNGYIDIAYALSVCSCGVHILPPYNVTVVYTAGLYSGTAQQADMLLALTIAAQINLNEIDWHTQSNEGAHDIGVQAFSNNGYSETRVKLGANAFGNSAAATKIGNLVKHLRSKPVLAFHR